jgi:hypothetical protein
MTRQYDDDSGGSMLGTIAKGTGLLGAGLTMTPVGRPLRKSIRKFASPFERQISAVETALGKTKAPIQEGLNIATGGAFGLGKLAQKDARLERELLQNRKDPNLWSSTGQNFRDLGSGIVNAGRGIKETLATLPTAATVALRKKGTEAEPMGSEMWRTWLASPRSKHFSPDELELILRHPGTTPDEKALAYMRGIANAKL